MLNDSLARRVVFRVAAVLAIGLAAMLVPLDAIDKIATLTAVGLGIAVGSVSARFDRVAVRAVGPALLVAAVLPASGVAGLGGLVALFVVGVAAFDPRGLARIAPALGLPVMALAYRRGQSLDPELLVAWIVAVIAVIATAPRGPQVVSPLTTDASRKLSRSASIHLTSYTMAAIGAIAAIGPVSLAIADVFIEHAPSFGSGLSRGGDHAGPRLGQHPGLRGGLDVGEPVALGDEVVLRVKADQARYWRGVSYGVWDGRRWSDDNGTVRQVRWSGDGISLPADESPPPTTGTVDGSTSLLPDAIEVQQRFTVERAGLDVILAAWRPMSLLVTSSSNAATLGDDGSIRLGEPLGAGATWTVTSTVVPASQDDLRAADPLHLSATDPIVLRYGREDDVSPEVAALARSIAADAPTTYDKVRALEAWMDANIVYSREGLRLAEGVDPVDDLLFVSRRGYCEQIGTALVVMLRSLAIPARLTVGYVPSAWDAGSGDWISRASDAHAWAEVYFPGVGWEGFDPTAGVPQATTASDADDGLTALAGRFSLAIGVAVLLVFGLGWLTARTPIGRWLLAARRRLRGRRASGPESKTPWYPIVEVHQRFDACCRLVGVLPEATMTVRDKADALIAAEFDAEIVGRVAAAIEAITYSPLAAGGSAGAPDVRALRSAFEALDSLEAAVQDDPDRNLEVMSAS